MKTIYLVVAEYAEYVNNEFKGFSSENVLFAKSTKEEAEKDVERLTKKNEQERTEWFETHTYGIFPSEFIIQEIKLY